jgi:hypothetical protein
LLRSNGVTDFCCTPDFITNSSTDFVTFKQLSNDTDTLGKNGVLKFLKEHGLQRYVDELIVIDYLIGNYNRSLSDMGFFVDADTMEFIKVAPIFDYEESMDIDVEDNDLSGVFVDDINKQLEMVSDFSWVDFDAVEESIEELKRIFCICDFTKEETDDLKEYLKKRMNQLKKFIPADQLMKSNKKAKQKKPTKSVIKAPDDTIIRIHKD